MGRVLIAEDEEGVRTLLADALATEGHEVVAVADGQAALAALATRDFDLLLTDLRMPGCDGMEVLRKARAEQPDIEAIVLTAFGAIPSAVEAMRLGAYDYLEKPIESPAALRALVAKALARRRALSVATEPTQGALLPSEVQLTWGAPSMAKVVHAIDRVARSAATVLLLGESGTGKEIAAHAIHDQSTRAARPFVAVNCAALAESLLESELFGHEKGAFTGAHARRLGRIELADGGSFFLDEVGELRLETQAKLLRILELRRFERVGGSDPVKVDVRFIAATHRNLEAMVRQGAFREDLYHRLAVFPIRIPALRERPSDILPLAEHLLSRLASAAGRPVPVLSAGARSRLLAGAWPGNVRELRNALERAMILEDGDTLGEALFPIVPTEARVDGAQPADHPTLEELERRAIEHALASTSGNRRAAAARLGIGLRTLYDKLKRYEMR